MIENAPCQGVPRFKVKVQLSDHPEDRVEEQRRLRWPNGRYRPWFFYLQDGEKFRHPQRYEGHDFSGLWVGPIERRGGKKGTEREIDHIALYNPHVLSDDPKMKPEHHKLALDLPDGIQLLGRGKKTKASQRTDGTYTHFWLYEPYAG